MEASPEAVWLTPNGYPNRTLYLGSLATMLDDRYARSRQRLDLDAVIEAGRGVGVAVSQRDASASRAVP